MCCRRARTQKPWIGAISKDSRAAQTDSDSDELAKRRKSWKCLHSSSIRPGMWTRNHLKADAAIPTYFGLDYNNTNGARDLKKEMLDDLTVPTACWQ